MGMVFRNGVWEYVNPFQKEDQANLAAAMGTTVQPINLNLGITGGGGRLPLKYDRGAQANTQRSPTSSLRTNNWRRDSDYAIDAMGLPIVGGAAAYAAQVGSPSSRNAPMYDDSAFDPDQRLGYQRLADTLKGWVTGEPSNPEAAYQDAMNQLNAAQAASTRASNVSNLPGAYPSMNAPYDLGQDSVIFGTDLPASILDSVRRDEEEGLFGPNERSLASLEMPSHSATVNPSGGITRGYYDDVMAHQLANSLDYSLGAGAWDAPLEAGPDTYAKMVGAQIGLLGPVKFDASRNLAIALAPHINSDKQTQRLALADAVISGDITQDEAHRWGAYINHMNPGIGNNRITFEAQDRLPPNRGPEVMDPIPASYSESLVAPEVAEKLGWPSMPQNPSTIVKFGESPVRLDPRQQLMQDLVRDRSGRPGGPRNIGQDYDAISMGQRESHPGQAGHIPGMAGTLTTPQAIGVAAADKPTFNYQDMISMVTTPEKEQALAEEAALQAATKAGLTGDYLSAAISNPWANMAETISQQQDAQAEAARQAVIAQQMAAEQAARSRQAQRAAEQAVVSRNQPDRGLQEAQAEISRVANIITQASKVPVDRGLKRGQKKVAKKAPPKITQPVSRPEARPTYVPNYVWVGGYEGGLVDLNNPGMGDVRGPDMGAGDRLGIELGADAMTRGGGTAPGSGMFGYGDAGGR